VYPIVKKISLIPLTKPRSERLKKKKSDSKEKWQHLLGCHFYKLGRALAFSERPYESRKALNFWVRLRAFSIAE
jgi:hypothetical protein